MKKTLRMITVRPELPAIPADLSAAVQGVEPPFGAPYRRRKLTMITHVAIRFQDKVYALPKPNRHEDVIRLIARETGVDCVNASGDDQGFLDENGTYYRRAPALVHALANNQIKDLSDIRQNKLFSDNVW